MRFNASCFFIRAFEGMPYIGETTSNKAVVHLSVAMTDEGKTALLKQMKRKEAVRWHPDKINARTGKVGEINEALGKANYVVAIRSAVQEVIELLE